MNTWEGERQGRDKERTFVIDELGIERKESTRIIVISSPDIYAFLRKNMRESKYRVQGEKLRYAEKDAEILLWGDNDLWGLNCINIDHIWISEELTGLVHGHLVTVVVVDLKGRKVWEKYTSKAMTTELKSLEYLS